MRRPTLTYLRTESGSGLILASAAVLAVFAANAPFAGYYFAFIAKAVPVTFGAFSETMPLAGWVKDALMAVFFFVAGMEMKFEVLRGEFSSPRRFGLPLAAAIGGLVVPAAIYLACNLLEGGEPTGWSAATATDGVMVLAALALAGPKMPPSLRALLLSIAIADNLCAVGFAAVFASPGFHWQMIACAGLALTGMALLGQWKKAPFLFYAVGFAVVWGFTLKSGVTPAAAGIACAMTIPIGMRRPGQASVLRYFMTSLHPYVAFAILPLFVFTAAGFAFRDLSVGALLKPAPIGLLLALWIGKPLGVFGFALIAATAKWGRRPTGAQWSELLGAALLCGAGFTVSLFIGDIVLGADPRSQAAMRAAIALASILSLGGGMAVLNWAQKGRTQRGDDIA